MTRLIDLTARIGWACAWSVIAVGCAATLLVAGPVAVAATGLYVFWRDLHWVRWLALGFLAGLAAYGLSVAGALVRMWGAP